jgi:hypothetical protein
MKKQLLTLIGLIIFITGCSQKTVIPQELGKPLNIQRKEYIYLNKQEELRKVDIYANQIFKKLEKNLENENKEIKYNILNNIYNNK